MNEYSSDEPYVFISYSHEDWKSVEKIIITLKRDMCRIWYDYEMTA